MQQHPELILEEVEKLVGLAIELRAPMTSTEPLHVLDLRARWRSVDDFVRDLESVLIGGQVAGVFVPTAQWRGPNVNRGCGHFEPMLGFCICGDPANHQPGGKYHVAGRGEF